MMTLDKCGNPFNFTLFENEVRSTFLKILAKKYPQGEEDPNYKTLITNLISSNNIKIEFFIKYYLNVVSR